MYCTVIKVMDNSNSKTVLGWVVMLWWGAGGFAMGYALSRLAGLPEKAARTNSIEVSTPCALGAMPGSMSEVVLKRP